MLAHQPRAKRVFLVHFRPAALLPALHALQDLASTAHRHRHLQPDICALLVTSVREGPLTGSPALRARIRTPLAPVTSLPASRARRQRVHTAHQPRSHPRDQSAQRGTFVKAELQIDVDAQQVATIHPPGRHHQRLAWHADLERLRRQTGLPA